MNVSSRLKLLRNRDSDYSGKVSFVELFFDLVFVFAITQLSHKLLEDLTFNNFIEVGFLLLAVWWVWIFTSWVTNSIDPRRTPVRLMLYTLMFAGLMLSMSLPEAFGEKGLIFGCSYAFMQTGRSLFMCWILSAHNKSDYFNYLRITSWLGTAGIFWVLGGFNNGQERIVLWCIALTIEYLGPAASFWTPGLGRSSTTDWKISGEHMAERCGLFIIIALGESILVTGSVFSKMTWEYANTLSFISAFVSTIAMWWIYFNIGAERAAKLIAKSEDPGRIGRIAYSYIHVFLVAGIIIIAVADEIVLMHPIGHSEHKDALLIIGGPAVYLIGNLLFKARVLHIISLSHLVGLAIMSGIYYIWHSLSPLEMHVLTTITFVVIAIWETLSLKEEEESL